ncbi:MAG: hypothetical protein A2V88_14870 [Elusimicrobia bacterium RBG_16_66_12]|nr:MAG: hypothetical protein A2V88_14870 [Elusimicrobia bacterium RBG_16_66_12]
MTWQVFGCRVGKQHLSDEHLLAAWQEGDVDVHLRECASCQARSLELRAFLDAVRTDAVAEADGVFTSERLAAQHAHVMRRLDRRVHPGRILSFPALPQRTPVLHLVARRWVALAAAAGLIIGLVAGVAVDRRQSFLQTSDARSTARPSSSTEPVSFNDEAFLSDLETAAAAPRVEELQALDALTPHVREVSTTLIR